MAYLLDVANSQAHERQADDALDTLLSVRRQSPEWVRYSVLARETTRMLLTPGQVSRSKSKELRDLARFLCVEA
jgi:hypothetical protein